MRRRAVLAGVTTALGAIAGCNGSEDRAETNRPATGSGPTEDDPTAPGTASATPTGTAQPPLPRITFRYGNPGAGTSRIRVRPDGTTVHEWSCRSGEQVTERGELTAAERDRLRSLLDAVDPSAWRDYYGCDRPCPTDLPGYGLVLERDGRTYETGYYSPARTPPDALVDLTTFFREAELRDVSIVDQCRSTAEPTTEPTGTTDATATGG